MNTNNQFLSVNKKLWKSIVTNIKQQNSEKDHLIDNGIEV